MKKVAFILIMMFMGSDLIMAQEQNNGLSQKMGIGFQLGQYQKDFGMGASVTSPYFLRQTVAVRLRGNLMFNEHLSKGITTWSPYLNTALGLVAKSAEIGNFLRLYGEGGGILLFPSSEFSTVGTEIGGYGLFGFEFFFNPSGSYFIELGGVGVGAVADKVIAQPIYSNGLVIQVGIKRYL